MTTEVVNLQRVVDGLRREADLAELRGERSAAVALNAVRAVLLEEIADAKSSRRARAIRWRGRR